MYKVVVNGKMIALIDNPRYIRLNTDSGSFVQTDKEHAEGIAVNGTAYSLPTAHLENSQGVAYLSEVNGGEYVLDNTKSIAENKDNIEENRSGLIETFELADGNSTEIADNRNAIMEIYEMLFEGSDE